MSAARATRVVALLAVVAAAAIGGFVALEWREVAGRFYLAQARRARGAAVDAPLRRAVRLLGVKDDRIRELLRVEPEWLAATFTPTGPSATAAPPRGTPVASAVVENVSRRRLVLFLSRSTFSLSSLFFAGSAEDDPAEALEETLANLPPAITLEPGERFTIADDALPVQAGATLTLGGKPDDADGGLALLRLEVTVLNRRLVDFQLATTRHAEGSLLFTPTAVLTIEGPEVFFVTPGAPSEKPP